MSSQLSNRKRVLIGIPVVLITAGILVACWLLYSRNVFFGVLIGLAILGMIAEYFVKKYEGRKKMDVGG